MPNQVYRFDPDTAQVRVVADGFNRCNGIAFTQDGKTAYMYVWKPNSILCPSHSRVVRIPEQLVASLDLMGRTLLRCKSRFVPRFSRHVILTLAQIRFRC